MDEKYITTREAAELLGVGMQRIRDLISAGRLKAIKVGSDHGGIWLVERQSVKDFKPMPRGRPPKKDTDSD